MTVWRVDPGDLRTEMHQLAFPGEDISDRPLPESVAPGIVGLLEAAPASGRYRLADFVRQGDDPDFIGQGDDVASTNRDGGCPEASRVAGDIAVVALVGDAADATDAAGAAGADNAPGDADAAAGCTGNGPIAMWLTIEVDDFAPAARVLPRRDRPAGDRRLVRRRRSRRGVRGRSGRARGNRTPGQAHRPAPGSRSSTRTSTR